MSTERYLNLVGGHFPFFFHSICFRVTTFAFLYIYLDLNIVIPLFLIWLSNIIIGCVIVGKQKISQVCLNSFLSILVPSCFVFSDTDGLTDKPKEDTEKVKREEKSLQQKVIKYQVLVSTTVFLLCLAVVFYLVNYTEYKYNNNSFSNIEFNILCCMILGLGVISYLFLFGTDIYEVLHLKNKPAEEGEIIIKYKEMKNEPEDMGEDVNKGVKITVDIPGKPDEVENIERPITTKKHRPCKKMIVSVICTVLAVSPMLAGYTYSSLATNSPAYLVIKMTDNSTVNIQMAKSRLLNFPSPESKLEAEGLLRRCGIQTTNPENLLRCQNQPLDQGNQILLVDTKAYNCIEELKKMDHIECLPYKGIVLMENFQFSSSRPVNFNFQRVTKFPIISVSYRDSEKMLSKMQDGQLVNMIFDDFDNMSEMGTMSKMTIVQ